MLFDPTERKIDPILFPTRIRTMKELVLALAIHDKHVAKPTQVASIIRTELTPPSEDCRAAKSHSNNELGFPALSRQRFVVAVPIHTRSPSPIKVQVRGGWHLPLRTPRLHQGCDSAPHSG